MTTTARITHWSPRRRGALYLVCLPQYQYCCRCHTATKEVKEEEEAGASCEYIW